MEALRTIVVVALRLLAALMFVVAMVLIVFGTKPSVSDSTGLWFALFGFVTLFLAQTIADY